MSDAAPIPPAGAPVDQRLYNEAMEEIDRLKKIALCVPHDIWLKAKEEAGFTVFTCGYGKRFLTLEVFGSHTEYCPHGRP
jgi:hypothetical protein